MNQNILKLLGDEYQENNKNHRLIFLSCSPNNDNQQPKNHYWLTILENSDGENMTTVTKNESRRTSIDLDFLHDNNNINSSVFVDLVLLPPPKSSSLSFTMNLVLTMKSKSGSGMTTFSNYLLQFNDEETSNKATSSRMNIIMHPPKLIPNSSTFSKWIPSKFQDSPFYFVLALNQSTSSLCSLHFVELFNPKVRPPIQVDTKIRIESSSSTSKNNDEIIVDWCDTFIAYRINDSNTKNEFQLHPIQITTNVENTASSSPRTVRPSNNNTEIEKPLLPLQSENKVASPKINVFPASSATPIGFGEDDEILDLKIFSASSSNNQQQAMIYPSICVLVRRNNNSTSSSRLVLMSVSNNEACYPVNGEGEEEMLWAESTESIIVAVAPSKSKDDDNCGGKILPISSNRHHHHPQTTSSNNLLLISLAHNSLFFVVDLSASISTPIVNNNKTSNKNISDNVIAIKVSSRHQQEKYGSYNNDNSCFILMAKTQDDQHVILLNSSAMNDELQIFDQHKSSRLVSSAKAKSVISASSCCRFVAVLNNDNNNNNDRSKIELYFILVSNKICGGQYAPQLVSKLLGQFEFDDSSSEKERNHQENFIFLFSQINNTNNSIRILFQSQNNVYLIEFNEEDQRMKLIFETSATANLVYFDENNRVLYQLLANGQTLQVLDCVSGKISSILLLFADHKTNKIIAFSCQQLLKENNNNFILRRVFEDGLILTSVYASSNDGETDKKSHIRLLEQKTRTAKSLNQATIARFLPSCPWMFVLASSTEISLYSTTIVSTSSTTEETVVSVTPPIKSLQNLSSNFSFEFVSSKITNSVDVAVFDSSFCKNNNCNTFVKMLSAANNDDDDELNCNTEGISRIDLHGIISATKTFIFDETSNSCLLVSISTSSSSPILLHNNNSIVPRKVLLPKRQYEISNLIQMLLLEFSATTTTTTSQKNLTLVNSTKLLEKFSQFQGALVEQRRCDQENIISRGLQDEIPFFVGNNKSSALYFYRLLLSSTKTVSNDNYDFEMFGIGKKSDSNTEQQEDDDDLETEEEITRRKKFAANKAEQNKNNNSNKDIGKISQTLQVDYFDKFLISQKILSVCSASTTFETLDGAGKCFLAHWEKKNLSLFSANADENNSACDENNNNNNENSDTASTVTATSMNFTETGSNATAASPNASNTNPESFCFKNDHLHPLPHSAICWAMISNSQDALVNQVICDFISNRMLEECTQFQNEKRRVAKRYPPGDVNHLRVMGNFSADFIEREVCLTGVGIWASKSATYLKQVAEVTTKKILSVCKDPRRAACWYVAQNKLSHLSLLCTNSQEPRLAAFFQRDFVSSPANRRAATDNAYAALGKGSVTLAIAFYLLARDPEQALRVMLLRGPFGEEYSWMLSVLLIRVWWSSWNNNNTSNNNNLSYKTSDEPDEEKPAIQTEEGLKRMLSRVVTEHFQRNLSSSSSMHQKDQNPILLSTSVWIKSALHWLNGEYSEAAIDAMVQISNESNNNNQRQDLHHSQNNSFFERLLFSEYALSHSVFLHGFCENSQTLQQLKSRSSLCVNATNQLAQEGNSEVLNLFLTSSTLTTIETSLTNSIQVLATKMMKTSTVNHNNNTANHNAQVQTGVLDLSAFGRDSDDDDDDSWMMKAVSQQPQQAPTVSKSAVVASTTNSTTKPLPSTSTLPKTNPNSAQVQTGNLDMSTFGNSDDDDDDSWMLQAVNNNNNNNLPQQQQQPLHQNITAESDNNARQLQELEESEKEILFWLKYIKSMNPDASSNNANRNPTTVEKFALLQQASQQQSSPKSCALDIFRGSMEIAVANSLIALKNLSSSLNPMSELEYASCVWTGLVLDSVRNKDALTLLSLLFPSPKNRQQFNDRNLLSKNILQVIGKNKMEMKHEWDIIWNLMEISREQNVRKSKSSSSSSSPRKSNNSNCGDDNSINSESFSNLLWTLLSGFAFLTFRYWSSERIIPSISASQTTLILTVKLLKEFISLFCNNSTLSSVRWRLLPNDDCPLRSTTERTEDVLTIKLEQQLLMFVTKSNNTEKDMERCLMILNVLTPRHLLTEFSEFKQKFSSSMSSSSSSPLSNPSEKNSTILIPKFVARKNNNESSEKGDADQEDEELKNRIAFFSSLISCSSASSFKTEELISSLKLQIDDGDIFPNANNSNNNNERKPQSSILDTNDDDDDESNNNATTSSEMIGRSATRTTSVFFVDEMQVRARRELRKKESSALRIFLMQPQIATLSWQLIDSLVVALVRQGGGGDTLQPSKPGLIPRCAQHEKFVANESGAMVPCLSEHSICVLTQRHDHHHQHSKKILNGLSENDVEQQNPPILSKQNIIGGFLMLTSAERSSSGLSLIVTLQHDSMLDGHYHRLRTANASEWQLEIPLTLSNFYFNNNKNSAPTLHLLVLVESADYFLISLTTSFVVAVFSVPTTSTAATSLSSSNSFTKPIRLFYFDDLNKVTSATTSSNNNNQNNASSSAPSIINVDPSTLIYSQETCTFLVSAMISTKKILITWPFDAWSCSSPASPTSSLFRIIPRPALNFEFSIPSSNIVPVRSSSSSSFFTASIVTRKLPNNNANLFYYALWVGVAPAFDEAVSTLLPLPPHWFQSSPSEVKSKSSPKISSPPTTKSQQQEQQQKKFFIVDFSPYFFCENNSNPHNLSFIGVFNPENQEMWIAGVKLIDTSAIRSSKSIPQSCLHAVWCHAQKFSTSSSSATATTPKTTIISIITTKNDDHDPAVSVVGSLVISFEYRVLVMASTTDDLWFYSLDDVLKQVVNAATRPAAIFQQEFIQNQNHHDVVCEKYERILKQQAATSTTRNVFGISSSLSSSSSSSPLSKRSTAAANYSADQNQETEDDNYSYNATTVIAWWMRRERDVQLFTTSMIKETSSQSSLVENEKHIYEHLLSKITGASATKIFPTGEAKLAVSTSMGGLLLAKVLFFDALLTMNSKLVSEKKNDEKKETEFTFSYYSSSSSSSSSLSSLAPEENSGNENNVKSRETTRINNNIQRVIKVPGIVGLVKSTMNNNGTNGIVFASFLSLH